MYSSTLLAILLASGSSMVSGHGIIKKFEISGTSYPGALGPGSDPSNSPVRAVSSGDPIDDVTSPSMLCGSDSKNAPISASAKPGDTLNIWWQAETGINWFHDVGPVQTYMAKCTGDCKDFTPTGSTQWFKISALGLVPGSDSSWYQAKMNDGSSLPATIPSDLADGNYLLRHEILALQNGATKDRAEFYPNCIQLTVSGGVSANVDNSPNPTTTFPGAYKDTDPGILVDVYTPPFNYVMPGPAVIKDASDSTPSSGGGDSGSTPSATAKGSSAPAPTSTTTSKGNSTTKGQCKLKKTKRHQKRALRAHAKRRMAEASY